MILISPTKALKSRWQNIKGPSAYKTINPNDVDKNKDKKGVMPNQVKSMILMYRRKECLMSLFEKELCSHYVSYSIGFPSL